MLERPLYQTAVAFLTVVALVGGLVALVAGRGDPGIRIVPAPTAERNATDAVSGETAVSGLVNINTATAEEMAEALPGIGAVLSQRIVAFREQQGPFVRTDQLMLVSGIGEITFERLRGLVTVGE